MSENGEEVMKCDHDGLAALEDCLECRIDELEAENARLREELTRLRDGICAQEGESRR